MGVLKEIDFKLYYEDLPHTYKSGFIHWAWEKILFVGKKPSS